jgi:hypothetical protein
VRRGAARASSAIVAIAALALLSGEASAQRDGAERPRWRTETRLDFLDFLGSVAASEAGIGTAYAASTYLRLAAIVGTGLPFESSGRVDVVGRYLLDPFFEHEWAPYVGGGATLRYLPEAADREWRPFLLLALGVEGPLIRGWTPAVEVGLGGGVRLGLVFRLGSAAGR